MSTVLKTPPTIESGVRKNTTGMLSCSKFCDHRPMMMPARPNTAETLTTQKRNSGRDSMCVAPKNKPITMMPMPVTVARSTTTER